MTNGIAAAALKQRKYLLCIMHMKLQYTDWHESLYLSVYLSPSLSPDRSDTCLNIMEYDGFAIAGNENGMRRIYARHTNISSCTSFEL